MQRVYLLTAECKKRSRRTDAFTRKLHSMCVSQKAVKSYLFCLSFVCLQHCTDDDFFFFSGFLVVCRFVFLAVTEHKGPAAPLHADASIVYREEEEGPIRHGQLPSLPVWTPAQAAPQQQDGLRCKECASVHKQSLFLFCFRQC